MSTEDAQRILHDLIGELVTLRSKNTGKCRGLTVNEQQAYNIAYNAMKGANNDEIGRITG